MKPTRFARLAAIALCAFAAITPAHADDTYIAPVEDAFDAAQKQYAEGRFGEAFGNFYWAAIRDHARAQEIVGIMYLLGPSIYGKAVRADPEESKFWLAEAARRGRDVARHAQCAREQAGKRVLAPALVKECLQGMSATARTR